MYINKFNINISNGCELKFVSIVNGIYELSKANIIITNNYIREMLKGEHYKDMTEMDIYDDFVKYVEENRI